jgi:hypothetical protein
VAGRTGLVRTAGALMTASVAGLSALVTSSAQAASPSMSSAQAVVAASSTMQSSSNVQIKLQGASVGGVAPPAITGSGMFNFRAARGRIDLNVAAPGGATAVHRTLFLPSLVYVRPPSAHAASLPAGKSWIVAELNRIESTSANFPQFVLQEEGLSPVLELQQLIWGAVSVKAIRARELNGTTASGYQVQIDLQKAANTAAFFNAPLALAIKTEINGLGTSGGAGRGVPQIAEKVWVHDGKVVLMSVSPPGAGVGVTTTAFNSYGVRVSVRAPSPGSVVDVTRLTPAAEKESGADVA